MVPFTVFSNPMKKGRPFRHIYVIFGRGLISKDLIAIKKWFLTTATLVAKKNGVAGAAYLLCAKP